VTGSTAARAVRPEQDCQTVGEVADRIRRALRADGGGWVEGEVQRWHVSPRGHAYFTLADERAVLDCRIWKQQMPPPDKHPSAGELVQVHFAHADFWPEKGRLQLAADRIRPTGEGELLRRKAEVLRRLEADGLTDPARRRALPAFPRRVGVIAGRDSDAREDVIRALRERFRPVDIAFSPALVEGPRAVGTIVDALGRLAGEPRVDVIVLARGGGSVADLMPFDDERLCRAIFVCGTPVVTSIGHTKQRPNCDHVAAACAHVPGRTAELVVPSAVDLSERIGAVEQVLAGARRRLADAGAELEQIAGDTDPRPLLRRRSEEVSGHARLIGARAEAHYGQRRLQIEALRLDKAGRVARQRIADYRSALDRHDGRRPVSSRQVLTNARHAVRHHADVIAALDFRGRGWILAAGEDGRALRSAADVAAGDELALRFHDGRVRARAARVQMETEGEAG
jgi:exodeoxyribonuclease VII large subunit